METLGAEVIGAYPKTGTGLLDSRSPVPVLGQALSEGRLLWRVGPVWMGLQRSAPAARAMFSPTTQEIPRLPRSPGQLPGSWPPNSGVVIHCRNYLCPKT